jgi:predicted DsbA family dithiol-disulfide isomerase
MALALDIVSDVVCPWCYIGKRRLEQALALWAGRHPDTPVTVTWHAYQLNPDMPRAGVGRKDYLEQKFGGPERARAIYARVEQAGREVGIPFEFARMQIQPNTIQAHRLVAWATEAGDAGPLVEALFRGYFLEARDFTDDHVLSSLAGEAGLDADAALAFLQSDALLDDVAADEQMARQIGVQGVPFFIVQRRLGVSGAQPAEVLVDAMEEALAADAASA